MSSPSKDERGADQARVGYDLARNKQQGALLLEYLQKELDTKAQTIRQQSRILRAVSAQAIAQSKKMVAKHKHP